MKKLVLGLSLILCGCVSESSTLLRDKDGHAMTCGGAFGFGLGAPIAMAMHADCIKKANAAGYYEIGKPIPPPQTAKQ